MDILFIAAILIGFSLLILAYVGCVLPALPGPPFGFLALLLLKLVETTTFSQQFLVYLALITAGVYILDYLLPLLGAKMFKASKQGIWFSILGMIIGIFFIPPFGMILGLLIGAVIGELIAGKAKSQALKVGIVSFIFSLLAILIKLSLVTVMTYYFTKAIFQFYA